MTRAVVVMGVSGSGKSTLGMALAAQLGWDFVEGDTLHTSANIAKMTAGIPLADEDRRPFLQAVAEATAQTRNTGVVVSCSALKRSYRDLIRSHNPDVRFVLPLLDRSTLLARLAARADHYMPVSLLDSQLALLEMPGPDEAIAVIDAKLPTAAQVTATLAALLLL
jgi:gluconokinase